MLCAVHDFTQNTSSTRRSLSLCLDDYVQLVLYGGQREGDCLPYSYRYGLYSLLMIVIYYCTSIPERRTDVRYSTGGRVPHRGHGDEAHTSQIKYHPPILDKSKSSESSGDKAGGGSGGVSRNCGGAPKDAASVSRNRSGRHRGSRW